MQNDTGHKGGQADSQKELHEGLVSVIEDVLLNHPDEVVAGQAGTRHLAEYVAESVSAFLAALGTGQISE